MPFVIRVEIIDRRVKFVIRTDSWWFFRGKKLVCRAVFSLLLILPRSWDARSCLPRIFVLFSNFWQSKVFSFSLWWTELITRRSHCDRRCDCHRWEWILTKRNRVSWSLVPSITYRRLLANISGRLRIESNRHDTHSIWLVESNHFVRDFYDRQSIDGRSVYSIDDQVTCSNEQREGERMLTWDNRACNMGNHVDPWSKSSVHPVSVYTVGSVDNHRANEFQVWHSDTMDHWSVIYNQNIPEISFLRDRRDINAGWVLSRTEITPVNIFLPATSPCRCCRISLVHTWQKRSEEKRSYLCLL